jgi:hypothetical protein
MTDVELVIKIPRALYIKGFENNFSEEEKRELIIAIGNGKPLPSGHGDLIDREELLKLPINKANYPSNYIKYAPTIIEKDRNED